MWGQAESPFGAMDWSDSEDGGQDAAANDEQLPQLLPVTDGQIACLGACAAAKGACEPGEANDAEAASDDDAAGEHGAARAVDASGKHASKDLANLLIAALNPEVRRARSDAHGGSTPSPQA